MRSERVRSGLRLIAAGVLCVVVATFFSFQVSRYLFFGLAGQSNLAFLGFFLGGLFSAWGIITAAAGLLQSGSKETQVRLAPTVLLLLSLIALFFILTFNSFTSPPSPPQLQRGESITI